VDILIPPQENRAKQLFTEDLIEESEKLETEAKARLNWHKPDLKKEELWKKMIY